MKFLYLFFFNQIKKINPSFLSLILTLQAFGLISLYSATFNDNPNLFNQQLLWLLIAWILFFIIYSINLDFISRLIWPLFLIHLICLILIFFVGKEVYHSTRWLDLGFFHYQPSETLKFILILLIAKKLSERKIGQVLTFLEILGFSLLILPPVALVLFQPDLGTAGMILLMTSLLIFFNGIQKKTLIALLLICAMMTPIAWTFILKPYQKSRVMSFLQPGQDPLGRDYNIIQSKIAIGSGQLFGKGFKQGTQNKLQFLPERHTDFIFSVLSEEYGFLGSIFTLILFFFLISFIFRLASSSRNRLSCYFCLGTGSFFLCHVVLNVAMIMGFFPVVGIPLPLFSYGGSHTITSMAFLGLVAAAHKSKDLF